MKKQIYLISFLVLPSLMQAQNYFAGTNAGLGNTGVNNTVVGGNALRSSNSGSNNSAFGVSSLRFNTTGAANTAAGAYSLFFNETGLANAALGFNSLYSNKTGHYNAALGFNSLYSNTSGFENTAIGYSSLDGNTTGNGNTASGSRSLSANTTGNGNTASGFSSLDANTTGYSNTALGSFSMYSNTTGFENVAVGHHAGDRGILNNKCTFLGAFADGFYALTNATAIGYGAEVNANNKVVIGNTSVTSIGGQVSWTVYSDSRLKTNINKSKLGLDFILQLNPITYNYKAEGQKDILYTGLLAQEVDAAVQKSGVIFSGVDKSGEYWGIRYAELTMLLITSVQELNMKAMVAEKENQQLKKEVEKLQVDLENLKIVIEKLQQSSKNTTVEIKSSASLIFQNQPNPFNQATTIAYQLQAADKNAAIVIRSMNGSIVKQINIPQTSNGKIIINGGELAAGTYSYSLLTNNGIVDTKLMIITK